MTHVLVSIPYGLGFRNLACCGVLRHLEERGATLTVLIPKLTETDRAHVLPELPAGIRIEELAIERSTTYQTLLKFLKQHFYGERTGLESFAIKKRQRRQETPGFNLIATAVEQVADLAISEKLIDRWLGQAIYPHEREYEQAMQTWKPDVLVVAKPGYSPEDLALLKVARRIGIPRISVDTTWDNMVSKRPPYILPDATTVWNDEMAEQAALYYGMPPAAVSVTGGVQFDEFFRTRTASREDTLRELGYDPNRPVVVFALSNPNFSPGTAEFASGLASRVAAGDVKGRPTFILRSHPWDRGAAEYAADVEYERLHIERPFVLPEGESRFECLPSRTAVERQGALYSVADVIVNIASTTSLDGIAADAPVVNIAFDSVPCHPDLSVARFMRYTHYRPIAESGAVRIAWNWDELVEQINDALDNPSTDADARARARTRFLGPADDRAAARVADAIMRAASP